MHSMGEHAYRDWHVERVQETRPTLYLFCLAGNTLLTAAVGAAIIFFSRLETGEWPMVPLAIGMGVVAYAIAVAFYTLLAMWRLRRKVRRKPRAISASLRSGNAQNPALADNRCSEVLADKAPDLPGR
jgi:uncharacterized membrane protein YbhN (UPF0104 family)